MTGRQCSQVESGYFFMALDYFLYEAELAEMGQVSPPSVVHGCLQCFSGAKGYGGPRATPSGLPGDT